MKTLGRVVAFLVVLSPFVAFAADDKPHPELDAKTFEIMKKLGALHKDAKMMRTEAVVETTIDKSEEEKREIKLKVTIDLERPNKFAYRGKSEKDETAGIEVISDGTNLVIIRMKDKKYTEAKSPKQLDRIGEVLQRLGQSGSCMLFQNVLAKDPLELLLEGVTKGEHAGMEKVNGKECHHLKFEQENQDWELWVAAEGKPFVLKAKSVISFGELKISTIETYTNWKVDVEPAKDAFVFKAPEGAKKVKSFNEDDDQ